jgi:hypothetical protein
MHGMIENLHSEFQKEEVSPKWATLFKDLIKGYIIGRDSRVGNENVPRSLAIEGKWSLRVRAVDRHHLTEVAIIDTR